MGDMVQLVDEEEKFVGKRSIPGWNVLRRGGTEPDFIPTATLLHEGSGYSFGGRDPEVEAFKDKHGKVNPMRRNPHDQGHEPRYPSSQVSYETCGETFDNRREAIAHASAHGGIVTQITVDADGDEWVEQLGEFGPRKNPAGSRSSVTAAPRYAWDLNSDGVRLNPRGASEVQSLVFSSTVFTKSQALAWALEHGYKADKADVKANTIRIRQADPELFQPDSFFTKALMPGVLMVGAVRR